MGFLPSRTNNNEYFTKLAEDLEGYGMRIRGDLQFEAFIKDWIEGPPLDAGLLRSAVGEAASR